MAARTKIIAASNRISDALAFGGCASQDRARIAEGCRIVK
jgi:hypothetical protein